MDFKNYDTFYTLNVISKIRNSMNDIYNSLNRDLISSLDNNKWQCSSKDIFNAAINVLQKKIYDFNVTINEVDVTIADIQKIQQVNLEIEVLEKENEALRCSQLQIDKIRCIENENKISSLIEMRERIKLNIFNKW